MSFIRSAREIAAEKAGRIEGLTEDERKRLREQGLEDAAKAVAEKYLGSGDERVLGDGIKRYGGSREELARGVRRRLLASLELRSPGRLESTIRGIRALPSEEGFESSIAKIQDIFKRYQEAENEARGVIDREGKETLHRLRIAGSAIGEINVRAMPEWEQRIKEIAGPFQAELDAVRQELPGKSG